MGQYDRKAQSQPKHGKPSDSGASKAPPPQVTRGVPCWKGTGYMPKKKSASKPKTTAAPEPPKVEHVLPVELEQRMLDVFRTTFPASNYFEELKPILQRINEALLRGDCDAAFGTEEYREAYAIRWSPSRALAYAQLLAWICTQRSDDPCIRPLVGSVSDQKAAKVVCFGGGAAEIMAFSALLRYLRPSEAAGKPAAPDADVSDGLEAMSIAASTPAAPLLRLELLSTADWSSVLSKLGQGLRTAPTLSKYASAAARAANVSFLSPASVEHSFTRAHVLDSSAEDLRTAIGTAPALLTLMSTLNELYMASMPRTTAFLRRLTDAAPKGCLLLVVDTPGAYSEVAILNAKEGEEDTRKYPMSRLLEYALVPSRPTKRSGRNDSDEEGPDPSWEKVISEPTVSYKLEESLRYPGSLENLRFQVHLFKRV